MSLSGLSKLLFVVFVAASLQAQTSPSHASDSSTAYDAWLNQDVRWIITREERAAFQQLSNDEQRANFIEAFWQRRDPTPDTLENEFKEEHYRRIAYANEHFGATVTGWNTERGHVYISTVPRTQLKPTLPAKQTKTKHPATQRAAGTPARSGVMVSSGAWAMVRL